MIKSARGFLSKSYNAFSTKAAASPAFITQTLSYKYSQRQPLKNKQTLKDKMIKLEQRNKVKELENSPSNPNALLKNDISIKSYMNKIYKTTHYSISGYLSTSYILALSPLIAHPLSCVFGGLFISVSGIIAFTAIPMKATTQQLQGVESIQKWENPTSRKLAFISIIAGSSIASAPFMAKLITTNPGIIPVAALSALMVMGGASAYSLYKPLGTFKTWESVLWSGLFGILGMNLASLGAFCALGSNAFTIACSSINLYGGLGLFTALQAYDTQSAIQDYQAGKYDPLGHVVNFFLNFENLFLRLAKFFE